MPTQNEPKTRAIKRWIVKNVRLGATRRDATRASGVSWNTFWAWTSPKSPLGDPEFLMAVEKAEANCRLELAQSLALAAVKGFVTKRETRTLKDGTKIVKEEFAPGDWRAAESYLKRRCRGEWGDSIDISRLTPEMAYDLLMMDDRNQTDAQDPEEELLERTEPGPAE